MLIYAAVATLLCSSLIDARLAPVDTSDALALCKDQQPYCKNPAVEIDKSTEFHPKIKASGEMKLNLTVKSNQPLTFPVRGDVAVVWTIKPPGDKCKWEIGADRGVVMFREILEKGKNPDPATCSSSEVNVAFRKEGADTFVDVEGDSCDKKSLQLSSACKYVPPNSDSIEGWDIWTLTVSASGTDMSTASITLKDAYVVYDAPEPTSTPSNYTFSGATHDPNSTTTITNATSTSPEAALSWGIAWGLIGGCIVLLLLLVVAAVMAIFLFCKNRKLRKNLDPQALKQAGWVNQKDLMKGGWLQDDPNRTATEDRICQDGLTCLESRSKRLEDENKVAAAETAQKPAPGEGQPEPKSQEVKGAAGTSNQPAADPQKNA